MGNIAESFKYKGSLIGKQANSSASSISIDERQYSGKIDAELSWIKARYSFRQSSRESPLSQPVNRKTLTMQVTDYLKNENGDVVFEETLKQQESYLVDKELFRGELRAGNAQNVFFVIDEKVFGPLSRNKSVVKNISLNPKLIKLNFSLSTEATESYANKNFDQIIIDTAGVTE